MSLCAPEVYSAQRWKKDGQNINGYDNCLVMKLNKHQEKRCKHNEIQCHPGNKKRHVDTCTQSAK